MIIEVTTFRLAPGASAADALAADQSVQEEFSYRQPGLVRRTTARDDAGEWLVITLWSSAGDADAAAERARDDPASRRLLALVDGGTLERRRYTDLGG